MKLILKAKITPKAATHRLQNQQPAEPREILLPITSIACLKESINNEHQVTLNKNVDLSEIIGTAEYYVTVKSSELAV
jgi:hypothetical protein